MVEVILASLARFAARTAGGGRGFGLLIRLAATSLFFPAWTYSTVDGKGVVDSAGVEEVEEGCEVGGL